MTNPFLDLFPGWGTYLAGIGTICLGVYLIVNEGKVVEGMAAIGAGYAAIRAKRAVTRPEAE
jgi:hypothetical protein